MAESGYWLVVLVSLFLSLLMCHLELSSSQALKSYGEACEADCDERSLLTCSKNTSVCECMLPNTMVYDPQRGKCVGKSGYACVRYASEFLCVSHSSCDRSVTTCSCDKGYFETGNGTCSIMAKYGESCSAKKPCDRNFGQICTEKLTGSGVSSERSSRSRRTCQCMFPSDQYYNSTANACISYVHGNCSFSWPCVRNAECSEDIYELRRGENIHGKAYNYNVTVGRKCKCKDGFTQTKARKCLPSYRQPCDLKSSQPDRATGGCNPEENLNCFDSSICLCKSPLSQIYDWKLLKCVTLVGGKCTSQRRRERDGNNDENADDAVCTSNAVCNINTGKCECKSGFSATPFSTCLKDFGAECSRRDGGCNIYRTLSCHQNSQTCGCIEDTLKYDTNTKTCSSDVGGPCGSFEYSEKVGFVFRGMSAGEVGEDGGEIMIMANHKRGVMQPTTNIHGGGSSSGGSLNSSLSTLLTHVISKLGEKTFHTFTKIFIECKSELECANEFGGIVNRNGDNVQGFCRLRS